MKLRKLTWLVALSMTAGLTSLPTAVNANRAVKLTTSKPEYFQHHRLQFHFSPQQGWMNDPNGMVYHNGEYHLFFQHYPDGTKWGPMHWGHAVSKDLVHWQELPIALFPDDKGWIFSGSAVVDTHNTSGLGTAENPPLVAIFTYHNKVAEAARAENVQTQALAYSLDNGRSWQKYAGNPVLEGGKIADFRDPKVFWHDESNQWVMALAVQNRIGFYASANLKNWHHLSDFGAEYGAHGGYWECPDLIKMQVEGSTEEKYVLLVSLNPGGPNGGSGTQYFVGDFDGKTFKMDSQFKAEVSKIPAVFPQDYIFEDFEGSLAKWQKQGDSFKQSPIRARENEFIGRYGMQLANSFNTGDASRGKLISQPFSIEKAYINFVIAGGKYPKDAAMNLIVDDEIIASATGKNSGSMSIASWDVSKWQGKQAHLEIVDNAIGPWGHISVDQIAFADAPAKSAIEPAVWLDYGADNYAGVTWSGIEDGRHLFIGWMNNWAYANEVPTDQWRGAMTVPRELKLHKTAKGYRVASVPTAELDALQQNTAKGSNLAVKQTVSLDKKAKLTTELADISLEVDMQQASEFTIVLANNLNEQAVISLNKATGLLSVDRTQAGQQRFDEDFPMVQTAPIETKQQYSVRIVQDVGSIEVFVDDGKATITSLVFPNKPFEQIQLQSDKSSLVTSWQISQLKSIW
ncbi:glycoside hydrolase family 32 protein [Catenovulum agarivorans]|uniref:glycoside hydrolase family 32 protein n=1 Tax=Catenovulum agarivorans TaxID=1172192 RepID=UPI001ED93291|nr:glycoside hydrolase family 32 protein [Catenovulum agarivorans]